MKSTTYVCIHISVGLCGFVCLCMWRVPPHMLRWSPQPMYAWMYTHKCGFVCVCAFLCVCVCVCMWQVRQHMLRWNPQPMYAFMYTHKCGFLCICAFLFVFVHVTSSATYATMKSTTYVCIHVYTNVWALCVCVCFRGFPVCVCARACDELRHIRDDQVHNLCMHSCIHISAGLSVLVFTCICVFLCGCVRVTSSDTYAMAKSTTYVCICVHTNGALYKLCIVCMYLHMCM